MLRKEDSDSLMTPLTTSRIPAHLIRLENFGDGQQTRPVTLECRRFSPALEIWTTANAVLRRWAQEAPTDERYHTVEVTIIYADGATFNTCFLLQAHQGSDPRYAPDLAKEVRHCLETFAGLRRPAHFTTGEYQRFLHTFGRASREHHARLLSSYEMPDPASLTPENRPEVRQVLPTPSGSSTEHLPA